MRTQKLTTRKKVQAVPEQDGPGYRWLEIVVAANCIILLFQLFPNAFWTLLAAADVREWSWTTLGIVNVLVIVGLAGLKAWADNRWNSR